jgi:predicted acylesterase/phospholipase RssA
MKRLGLALSGGGFRAVLYHLGVVRFARDAGLLHQVTHITSVSGGSVLGAHLALNWDRYCGTDEEFQEVTDEILRLLQVDVRNRIVRRFPLTTLANVVRRTLRMPTRRQFTRAGLLEQHYEKFLYGDTSLFSLPDRPRLYILSTNLSEGSLCAFYRDGLLLQRRTPGRGDRFEHLRMGLATVPMAVAASSAFPGFFPPLELRSWEVGAKEGEFSRHSFTDGGIYDNIGLRMFHQIQEASRRDESVPEIEDVLDAEAMMSAFFSAGDLDANSPMRRLWERVSTFDPDVCEAGAKLGADHQIRYLIESLGTIIRNDELYRDPVFQAVMLINPRDQSLYDEVKSSPDRPEMDDHIRLNRQLVEAVLRQSTGKPCLRSGGEALDGILVSDAGATFKVRAEGGRAGGLMSTAMRSSDILMDRVNQLELESFHNAPGVVFFPITKVVESSQDPHAPHPEIQHHAALIRTDMDAFTDLEISSLVQHGYCVARQACRDQALLAASEIPSGPPWNPLAARNAGKFKSMSRNASLSDTDSALQTARSLQQSSSRRILSTLFSLRDWPTYVWVPLIATIMLTLPYLLYKSNKTAAQRGYVLSAIAETSPLYRKILSLMEGGPVDDLTPVDYEEVSVIENLDFTGFDVLSDDRIFDLRDWTSAPADGESAPFVHIRIRVRRKTEISENPHLRFQLNSPDEKLAIACRTDSLNPRYKRMGLPDGHYVWELDLDFTSVPVGADAELVLEGRMSTESAELFGDEGRFQFSILADTGLAQIWMLMPTDRSYEHFEISGWPIDAPEQSQTIVPTTTVELPIASIATFQLINPKHDYRYECRWKWHSIEQQ